MRSGFRSSAIPPAFLLILFFANSLHAFTAGGTVKDCNGQAIDGVKIEITIGLDDPFEVTPVGGEWTFNGSCTGTDDVQVDLVFSDGRKAIVSVFHDVDCTTGTITVDFDCKLPPEMQQTGLNDCAPTAAASLIGWLRQNGYPGLGAGTLLDLLEKISQDARTSNNTGTDFNDLIRALNKLIDDSQYKGCLRTFAPRGVRFPFGDKHFFNGKKQEPPFFALLQSQNASYAHYVLVYGFTVNGDDLTLEVMDPATGQLRTIQMSLANGRYTGQYNNGGGNRTVYINAFVCVEPRAKAPSASPPGTQRKISYTPHFMEDQMPNDFHVRVYDCASTYTVENLPPGWNFEAAEKSDGCYLSFWNDGVTTAALMNEENLVVVYEGDNPIGITRRAANFTYSGTSDPEDNAAPKLDAVTVLPIEGSLDPAPPQSGVVSLFYSPSGGTTRATFDWDEPEDGAQNITRYELYNVNSGELVATRVQSVFTTDVETSNSFEALEVSARYSNDILSPDTATATVVYVNNANPIPVTPQQPNAKFLLPFNDCPATFGICNDANIITVSFLDLTSAVSLYLSSAIGKPFPAIPAELGVPHERFYHLAAPGVPALREVVVVVPFDEDEVGGGNPRLLTLRGGQWIDVTLGISQDTGRIIGLMTTVQHEIGMLAVVTQPREPVHGWRIE